jgi:omega-6 fatty acid desaturase (delta-12 desaturase)
VHYEVWFGLILIVPASGFLLRLFMLQHDCGHGSLFAHRKVDDWTGRALGVLTLTPYDYWRSAHAAHHATAGNLDERGIGDIRTLTVSEYQTLSKWGRLGYRLYRHPLVMFGVGPVWLFIIKHRLPIGMMRSGGLPWLSTMGTNVAVALMAAGMIWLIGFVPFMLVHMPIVILAGAAGIWLFYVQHQFEDTYWAEKNEWAFQEAAIQGSSNYKLPQPLQWLSGNIGIHHVHHLSSRVPFYRLPEIVRDFPEFAQLGGITISESVKSVKLVLWDESRQKLVSFREASHAAAT